VKPTLQYLSFSWIADIANLSVNAENQKIFFLKLFCILYTRIDIAS
jgi:hypothetical protein